MLSRLARRPVLVCSAFVAMVQAAPAQSKVAVVNLQQAIFGSAEIDKANKEMQAKFKPDQDRMEKLQKEIAQIAQQLQAGSGKLSQQAENDLQLQGQRKQRDLQRLQDDLQSETNSYRNEILSKSSAKMTEVIKKLAEAQGFDLIVDTSSTLYFKPALDITKEATAAYDKAYPAK